MVDRGCWGAPAVRKYWLLQDFSRNVALRRILRTTFVEGDIHRQHVEWDNGTEVWVNRGKRDWPVQGRVLPEYGYFVKGDGLLSAIERINGVIVEHSRGPGGFYCNARGLAIDNYLQLEPFAEKVEYLGGNRFRMIVRWDAKEPAPPGYMIFVHFLNRNEEIAFQGDHAPQPPPDKWSGVVRTGSDRTIVIPDDCTPGEYRILIGLYNPKTGNRARLIGRDRGAASYDLGTLIVEGEKGKPTGVRLAPSKDDTETQEPRKNIKKVPVDFGPVVTNGACRVQVIRDGLRVIPLPNSPSFTMRLRPAALGIQPPVTAATAKVLDENGNVVRTLPLPVADGLITLKHDGKAFAYEVQVN